jgi:hypothetical protein
VVKALPLFALAALAAATSACTHIGQPGTVTIYGRGAELLGKDGSPLLDSGRHARQVPNEWAAGYAQRGIDDAWRTYWALQDEQGANAHDRPGGAQGASYNGGQDGATRVYKVDVPEYIDDQGIRRAPRRVSVPITEFIEAVPAREGVRR